jgi:hypothetical protein
MSSSIPIPSSRNKQPVHAHARNGSTSASSYSYHSTATPGSSYASSAAFPPSSFGASPTSLGKGKGKEREVVQPRRASLLGTQLLSCYRGDHHIAGASNLGPWYADASLCAIGSSLSKSEHTVVDLGHGGTPRLVSCVKRGQGFDWNQGKFLSRARRTMSGSYSDTRKRALPPILRGLRLARSRAKARSGAGHRIDRRGDRCYVPSIETTTRLCICYGTGHWRRGATGHT